MFPRVKKIRVACDLCRRKKVRCDGQPRCYNCAASNEPECTYAEPAKKAQRLSLDRKNSELYSRMDRLESLMVLLARHVGLPQAQSLPSSPSPTIPQPLADNSQPPQPPAANGPATANSQDSEANDSSNTDSEKPRQGRRNAILKNVVLFFGTHSLFSIMSENSVSWISRQLGENCQDALTPFNNLPILVEHEARLFLIRWIDPPALDYEGKRKLLKEPFCKDSKIVFGLLDEYLPSLVYIEGPLDFARMRQLFEDYYSQDADSNFSTSELLLMTVCLLYALFTKVENSTEGSADQEQYSAMWDEYLTNAVHYYHRVCVIGEGLDTIEALLMFTGYLECNWKSAHVSYMVLAPAIRYAQDMGLHRIETYYDLDAEMVERRKKLWWLCHNMDLEVCFRSGKPPMINKNDVSPEILKLAFTQPSGKLSETEQFSIHNYFSVIAQVRSTSYDRVFSASANFDSFKALLKNLDALNEDLFKIAAELPSYVRPYFFNDPQFTTGIETPSLKKSSETSWMVKLTFFYHIMLINRLPLILNLPNENEEKKLHYKNLSLNGARTVLKLLNTAKGDNFSNAFYEWVMFFPSTAFLHLLAACMNFPNTAEAYGDLTLLIEASMSFMEPRIQIFSKFYGKPRTSLLTSIMFCVLLKIVITVFELKTGLVIIRGNKSLEEHLNLPKKFFPELYVERTQFRTCINGCNPHVVGRSPFNDADASPAVPTGSFTSGNRSLLNAKPTPNSAVSAEQMVEAEKSIYNDIDQFLNNHRDQLPNFFFDSDIPL